MPDFSQLMNQPAGQAKKPKVLVVGNYSAIIKSYELIEAPAGKDYKTIIRFHVGLIGWPDSATEEDKQQEQMDGSFKPIDLAKRQLRRDFYDNSMYRLDEFIRSCGIEPNGRSYAEVLPELTGAQIVAEVQQYLNGKTNELGNQIGNMTGAK